MLQDRILRVQRRPHQVQQHWLHSALLCPYHVLAHVSGYQAQACLQQQRLRQQRLLEMRLARGQHHHVARRPPWLSAGAKGGEPRSATNVGRGTVGPQPSKQPQETTHTQRTQRGSEPTTHKGGEGTHAPKRGEAAGEPREQKESESSTRTTRRWSRAFIPRRG